MGVVSLDFETYSEAGYHWLPDRQKWQSVSGPGKVGGLPVVGAYVYARHPSTEILSAAYSLDGAPVQHWRPGVFQPRELLAAVEAGATVQAYNSLFEFWVWAFVGRRVFGWPELPLANMRDTMANVRAFGLPGALGDAAKALGLDAQKDSTGKALIKHFSVPCNPTKGDPSRRRRFMHDAATLDKAAAFELYNVSDVVVESAVLRAVPPLSPHECDVWAVDQIINDRGVSVDVTAARACDEIVAQTFNQLTAELRYLTAERIQSASQAAAIVSFLGEYGIHLPDLTADTVALELKHGGLTAPLPPWARRVLEIRQQLGLSSVKKLKTLLNRVTDDDPRLRGLFSYYGAERTGRWAGRGVQPHNLPRGDAGVARCDACERWQGAHLDACGACGATTQKRKWCFDASESVIDSIVSRPGLDALVTRWGDMLAVVSGSLRAMFEPRPGFEFICSDYRAIEAVVLAALAGEDWRLEVFRTHGKIYEMSAAKITGKTLEFYLDYKAQHGEHHPDRGAIGKIAELASGYGGGVGAWKQFGAGEFMSDEEIDSAKSRWRKESPAIVNFWYDIERAAMSAVRNPGTRVACRAITYVSDGVVLRCVLPSGRSLAYHRPSVVKAEKWGLLVDQIQFYGHNSNAKYGAMGWGPLTTYGGRLVENITQAVARDVLAHALVQCERRGYPVVMHIHDEIVAERRKGEGSVAELESIMGDLPTWCAGWPIIAAGGWVGRRYRKD